MVQKKYPPYFVKYQIICKFKEDILHNKAANIMFSKHNISCFIIN